MNKFITLCYCRGIYYSWSFEGKFNRIHQYMYIVHKMILLNTI